MSDGPKLIQPFAPTTRGATTAIEMERNADRWAGIAKRELPDDVGFVFFFLPKGGGAPEIRTDMKPENLKRMLEMVVRRFPDQKLVRT